MTTVTEDPTTVRYHVTGMDCSDCVEKIEKAARKVAGVDDVRVSLTSQTMTLRLPHGDEPLAGVEYAVAELGYTLTRLDPSADTPEPASYLTPGYTRALWIVIALNVGYGLIEMVGGFLADSQALKADALDFVGDGLISFLGLLAIGWRPIWRARSALIQGMFLGLLGLGVIGTTIYRVIEQGKPEAEAMGVTLASPPLIRCWTMPISRSMRMKKPPPATKARTMSHPGPSSSASGSNSMATTANTTPAAPYRACPSVRVETWTRSASTPPRKLPVIGSSVMARTIR